MTRLLAALAMAFLAVHALATPVAAQVYSNSTGLFDFCDAAEYAENFVELRRGAQITPSTNDLGNTGHCALNFTGSAGAAGDTWITRYSGPVLCDFCETLGEYGVSSDVFSSTGSGLCMAADILVSPYNNAKGAGLIGLLDTEGGKGLLGLLINNGNTDKVTINTIDPATGKIALLASKSLGAAIAQNAWYKVFMYIISSGAPGLSALNGDDLLVRVDVYTHTDPTNPNSPIAGYLGSAQLSTSLSQVGVGEAGFVGMAAWAKSAVVNSSITNFWAVENCD